MQGGHAASRDRSGRGLLGMMFQPAAALESGAADGWPATGLAVSGAAFLLFFLQTGLDRLHAGTATPLLAAGLAVLGLVGGTLGITVLATATWGFSRILGGGRSWAWALRACGMAYAPALVYGLFGLAARLLLGWNTSVSFGLSGFLWSILPLMAVHENLVGGSKPAAVVLTLLSGGLVLAAWGWLAAG